MGRIRAIKPEIRKHEELFDAEKESNLPIRLAFIGLILECDREGRFKWRPRSLKLEILPHDDVDFSKVLDVLEAKKFIVKYDVNGEIYGCIPTFLNHQIPGRDEPPSEIPGVNGGLTPRDTPPNHTVRHRVYNRDDYVCVYCGEKLRNKLRSICIDLVIPRSQGGIYSENNMVTSCKKCAATKQDKAPSECAMVWPDGRGETRDHTVNGGINDADNGVLTGTGRLWDKERDRGRGRDREQDRGKEKTYVEQARRVGVENPNAVDLDDPPDDVVEENHDAIENCEEGGDAVPMAPSGAVRRKPDRVSGTDVLHVFRHWQTTMGHLQAKLDDKRRARIRNALREGYTVLQLCDAVSGCARTPHNMGDTDGQRYDGLHLILRNSEQIERFIRNFHNPPKPKNKAEKLLDDNVAVGLAWLKRTTGGQKND